MPTSSGSLGPLEKIKLYFLLKSNLDQATKAISGLPLGWNLIFTVALIALDSIVKAGDYLPPDMRWMVYAAYAILQLALVSNAGHKNPDGTPAELPFAPTKLPSLPPDFPTDPSQLPSNPNVSPSPKEPPK